MVQGGSLPDNVTVSVTIEPANDIPSVSGDLSITVDEGGSVNLAATDILIVDPDNTDAQLEWEIASLPAHGWVVHDVDGTLNVGDRFSQAEVKDGRVSFVSNGDEEASDAFGLYAFDHEYRAADGADDVGSAYELPDATGQCGRDPS